MLKRLLALLLPLLAIGFATPVVADDDGVVRFATLPKPGPGFPEGIAADHRGRIFVATFDFSTTNVIHVFDRNGKVDETISLPGAVPLGAGVRQRRQPVRREFRRGQHTQVHAALQFGQRAGADLPDPDCPGPSAGSAG